MLSKCTLCFTVVMVMTHLRMARWDYIIYFYAISNSINAKIIIANVVQGSLYENYFYWHTPRTASASCSGSICTAVRWTCSMLVDDHNHRRFIDYAKLCAWAESKWGVVDRCDQQNAVFATHNEGSFSTISTDLLCLPVTQMPRSRYLAIFVLITIDDRQTDCFIPCCACARGVMSVYW